MDFVQVAQIAESFSWQQMLARRNFKDRLTRGGDISLRETLYPLMQGYDSVAVKADVELGGFDQLFNLKAGRVIQPLYNKPPQDIMTTTMLEGTDGRKMSTSWGNVINIIDEPNDIYGKLMSIKDELIAKYLLLTTCLSQVEIDELVTDLKKGANPKTIKTRLAYEVVAMYYNTKVATTTQIEFEQVHKQGKLPTNIPNKPTPKNKKEIPATDLLVYLGLATSKSEARRLIDQGGVKIDGEIVKDWKKVVLIKKEMVVQVGSRKFVRLD